MICLDGFQKQISEKAYEKQFEEIEQKKAEFEAKNKDKPGQGKEKRRLHIGDVRRPVSLVWIPQRQFHGFQAFPVKLKPRLELRHGVGKKSVLD